MSFLENINGPEDVKKLSIQELKVLSEEIREYMVSVVSQNGGHLAPNLGIVELTLALHYVFDSPRDKLIWDVGHQGYPHKIITGRREALKTLRKLNGISGFLKRTESEHDIFGAGHASTALSAALGIATARDLNREKYKVVAIVGDGALTGGMALEALNNIGQLKKELIIVLNDNEMSIAENVGAISNYLSMLVTSPKYHRLKEELWEFLEKLPSEFLSKRLRELAKKIKENLKSLAVPTILFEELGIEYAGPLNGHDLEQLIETFSRVNRVNGGPILLHVLTKKGKGYLPAEENPELFHGIGPFDKKTGKPIKTYDLPSYTSIFRKTIVDIGEMDKNVVAITAAMPLGTGLDLFKEKFPDRFFDVGIAEQHAVTFAAGLALKGLKPYVCIYSTFLQRSFDQLIHDVGIQKIPVKIVMDRGGVVGEDGATHNGVFDFSFLRIIPNYVVMAPKDEDELVDMLYTMLEYNDGPITVRYPKGSALGIPIKENPEIIPIGKWEKMYGEDSSDVVILATGSMVYPSLEAAKRLSNEGFNISLVNARFIKPLDLQMLTEIFNSNPKCIFTVEEGNLPGGFGSAVVEYAHFLRLHKMPKIINIGLPDVFIEQGSREEILKIYMLDEEGIHQSMKIYLQEIL
ncbi:MAG TPA: 1-deoxy-D-xylulose-5-phosphate synthase [Candidatus Hydrothermia bacterium]|nr:1-deoxy-D-xylulose-5-phosphate synthase [Candidatus Hydrothermae bacterium]MDD3649090.1 1-deoxy-D-xylulose-5-phosphate synthase [Candidatus Hydrothermia bacterium]MDD5572915.1 1-deoxy-D-xylulose-5-phosphate synthase [Candidatus Hydrothermia bacterium]HOK23029.1 1-deoxy-D-xylulose-5-phosphate synthase [Candidatus Hydrothermia bacterium]HOL23711.1 1-deoxy-D-xylulose-5-phosphate synthase [Candidatus Hydrothermia bacterium]